METMNPAIDTFYKRSAVMGFRAGGIVYILNGYKETSLVVDFALWVADYVLQQQVSMWGAYLENAQSMQSANPVANLYKELPDEFTREELTNLRILSGKSDNVRMIISRWKKANMIREVEKNRYAKITIGKA